MSALEIERKEVASPPSIEANAGPEMVRRDFFKRFGGGHASETRVGCSVLLSPGTSKVQAGTDLAP